MTTSARDSQVPLPPIQWDTLARHPHTIRVLDAMALLFGADRRALMYVPDDDGPPCLLVGPAAADSAILPSGFPTYPERMVIRSWDDLPATAHPPVPDWFLVAQPQMSEFGKRLVLALAGVDRAATYEAARIQGLGLLWQALGEIAAQFRLAKWLDSVTLDDRPAPSVAHLVHGFDRPLLALSHDGVVLSLNSAASALLGRTAAELLGQSLAMCVPEAWRADCMRRIRLQPDSPTTWIRQFCIEHPDQGTVDLICVSKPLATDQAEPTRILALQVVAQGPELNTLPPPFGSLLTQADDAVLVTDGDELHFPGPRILYANRGFSRMTGHPVEAVLGRSPHMIQGERTDREALRAFVSRLQRHGNARVETVNYSRDGVAYTVQITAYAASDPLTGRPQYISLQRDVSRLYEAERTNRLLRLALHQTGDGLLLCDAKSRIVWCNAAARSFVRDEHHCIGQSVLTELVTAGDQPRLEAAVRRTRPGVHPQQLEACCGRQGRALELSLNCVAHGDDGQEFLIVTVRDLTTFSDARQQLELQSMAMEVAPAAMALITRDGHLLWKNTALVRLAGGKSCDPMHLDDLLPADARRARDALRLALASGNEWRGEIAWSTGDGRHDTLYQHTLAPLPASGACDAVTFLFSGQNVTARRDYARALEVRNRRLHSLVALQDVARSNCRLDDLALDAMERVRDELQAQTVSLLLPGAESVLETVASTCPGGLNRQPLPICLEWLSEWLAKTRDGFPTPLCPVPVASHRDLAGHHAVFIAPLPGRSQRRGAVVAVLNADAHPSLADSLYVRAVTDILDTFLRAEDQRGRTEQLIHNDPLTDLPNRRSFMDQLRLMTGVATQEKAELSVLVLDLNRFRVINDTFGHAVGDHLLKSVAHRLRDTLPRSAVVARLGADEFGVLLPFSRRGQDERVAQRLLAAVAKPIHMARETLHPHAASGIARFPADAREADELLLVATAARREAKRLGRQLLDGRSIEVGAHRADARVEHRLHTALDAGSLHLHYQPIEQLNRGTVSDAEVLVRWNDPVLGVVPPASFIAVAESTGAIRRLDRHVLSRALEDGSRHGLNLSVNVSVQTLLDDGFTEFVRRRLVACNRRPETLTLEITERVFAEVADITPIVDELVALGVQIAIDDFGMGYSSLHLLPELPVSRLKIDGSFMLRRNDKPGYAAVILAAVRLAHGIGVHCLIEGVESQSDLDWVRAAGIDFAQGYHICRPMGLQDLLTHLARINASS